MDTWAPSTLYSPGALVKPATVPTIALPTLNNPSFETGDSTGWSDLSSFLAIVGDANSFDGAYDCQLNGKTGSTTYFGTNDTYFPVTPGKTTTGHCKAMHIGTNSSTYRGYVHLILKWYSDNTGSAPIQTDAQSEQWLSADNGWISVDYAKAAPAGAKYVRLGFGLRNADTITSAVDSFSIELGYDQPPFSLVYQATQADIETSGSTEPTWPTTLGSTVVDGGVTWTTVYPNRITWQTKALMVSGTTQPTWPAKDGTTVLDNTITWTASVQRITDLNCPQSKVACIAASKVYAANGDIINYSATVNPLDWTSQGDAGYIPFGLQKYGSNPVSAMNLYRSNLAAFNAEGFQMWQVDANPANISLLDALPIGTTQNHALVPVGNDLFLLSPFGIRSLAVSAASNSMETHGVGEPIDPLVNAMTELATDSFHDVGRGQYLISFSGSSQSTVFVYTLTSKSWSRYIFPFPVEYFAQVDDSVYFRSGTNIVAFDEAAADDMGTAVNGTVQWAWIALSNPGITTRLLGCDLVATDAASLAVGDNENDLSQMSTVGTIDADTVPGFVVPLQFMAPSYSFKLDFTGTAWRLYGLGIYFDSMRPLS